MPNTIKTTVSMHDQNTAPRPIHSSLGEKKFWADNLLQMIAGLPVSAVERSFKMGPQSLLSNRFLVGLSPAIWQRISWGEMITRLGMPSALWSVFDSEIKRANYLGVAFEEGTHGCVFKAYLEFPVHIQTHIPESSPPALLYRGLKWNPQEQSSVAITDYLWKPRMTAEHIAKHIAPHLERLERPAVREAVQEVLRVAASRKDAREFSYLEVVENGNPRNSFDLNVYAAKYTLGELRALLGTIGAAFDIPENQISDLLDTGATDILGHISAGIDRAGCDFMSIYHDTP